MYYNMYCLSGHETVRDKSEQKVVLLYTYRYSKSDSKRDLGVHVNKSFNFNEHCHFVTNKNRRRVLYPALVRSQFEHCSPIWRPCGNTMIDKFEKFQKNAF